MNKVVKIAVVTTLAALLLSACSSGDGKEQEDTFFGSAASVQPLRPVESATPDTTTNDLPPVVTDEPAPVATPNSSPSDAVIQQAFTTFGLTGEERFTEVSPVSDTESSLVKIKPQFDADITARNAFITQVMDGSSVSGIDPESVVELGNQLCPILRDGNYKDAMVFLLYTEHTGVSLDNAPGIGSIATTGVSVQCPDRVDEFIEFVAYLK